MQQGPGRPDPMVMDHFRGLDWANRQSNGSAESLPLLLDWGKGFEKPKRLWVPHVQSSVAAPIECVPNSEGVAIHPEADPSGTCNLLSSAV